MLTHFLPATLKTKQIFVDMVTTGLLWYIDRSRIEVVFWGNYNYGGRAPIRIGQVRFSREPVARMYTTRGFGAELSWEHEPSSLAFA